MADSQKLVLMIQPTRLQGLIWQEVLRSQQISVIWESPEADLADNLNQLKAAGLTLPNLLLVDIRIDNFNPYAFCRWCREHHPGIKVILVNASQKEISPPERQWAMNQGAMDLFPGFQLDNLVSSVSSRVSLVLKILDDHALDNGALVSVLLSMKRELETRRSGQSAIASSHGTTANGNGRAKAMMFLQDLPASDAIASSFNSNDNGNGNGNLSANRNGASSNPLTPKTTTLAKKADPPTVIAPTLSSASPPPPPPPHPPAGEPSTPTDAPPNVVRKYRGASY